MLIVHIISGLIAVVSALSLFSVTIYKNSYARRLSLATISSTAVSVLSGVGLIVFSGSSIVRVCGEAMMLTALSVGSVYYARLKNNQEVTSESN